MADEIDTEICVIGGGPAGATTALRLAQLGRNVCLLDRATFPRPHVGESLPSSIWPILQTLRLSDQIAGAGFLRSTGSILHWGGVFERRGPAVGAPGLLVDRGRFDALLLDAARRAGVRVLSPARAYRPVRGAAGWDIPIRSPHGQGRIRARVLVDAAGRQAGLGRRFRATAPPLLALYAYWNAPPGFGAQTRIEAGAAQWYWGAMLPDGSVNAMVFVDPAICTGLSPADRRDLYLNLLAQSTLLSPSLEQRRIGPARRADASARVEITPPARDLLRVGEASFSVDPLSSQGVQMAMAQAVQAAVVINTVLSRPDNADLALSFYQDRQAERVQAHTDLAAEFYARQSEVHPTSFWCNRAGPRDELPLIAPNPPQDRPLRLSSEAKLTTAGIQTATHIEPATVLHHPGLSRPVANLEGTALAPLIGGLNTPATAAQIVSRWSGVTDAARAWRILGWLWQNRVVTG